MIVSLPLYVHLPRKTIKDKKINLNLNVFKTLSWRVEGESKKVFTKQIKPLLKDLPIYSYPVRIIYTLYPRTLHLCDVANICCIIDKYYCDALTHCGVLPDDDYRYLDAVAYKFGKVDRKNGRVDAKIKPRYLYTGH